ncbi:MAG: TonB-dependent receptor [Rhizomicrobium sp.]
MPANERRYDETKGVPVYKINSNLRSALLLGAAAVAAVSLTTTAFAQETMETVVVTGSHIAQPTLDSAGPLTMLSNVDIGKMSSTSVDQMLQQLPAAASGQIGQATNNGGYGDAFIDLRGLGASRTLVLIDGKRTVNGSATGVSSAVDLTSIPTGMIDHIEVYQDGASAIYGSDAIAGVVNVILKSDFTGVQASAQYGQTDKNDDDTSDLSAVFGYAGDKGHVIVGLEYANRTGVLQGDRYFSHAARKEPSAGVIQWKGSYNAVGGYAFTYNKHTFVYGQPVASCGGATSFTWQSGSCQAWAGASDTFNYAARSYLSTPQDRTSLTASGEYDISSSVTAFAEGYFTNRNSTEQLAPDPSGPIYIPASNPYNTTGSGLNMYRRPLENGNRIYTQSIQTYRVDAGLKGTLDFIPDGTWEVNAIYGRTSSVSTTHVLNLLSHYAIALDPALCAADPLCSAAAANAGQSAVDVFGPNTIKAAWLPYLTAETHDTGGNSMEMYTAAVNGTAAELPAGKLGFAAGFEYRQEAGFSHPDYLNATSQTDQGGLPTDGGFKSYEMYGELSVPIIKDLPFAEKIDLSLAGRLGEFSTAGSSKEAPTYKIGLNWQPIDDLKFRGIFSRATRFPSIGEMFGGSYTSYDFAIDPCNQWATSGVSATVQANCAAQGVPGTFKQGGSSQVLTEYTSNPALSPERATTYTLGLVFTPQEIPGLTATVDYWHVHVNGYVGTIDTQTELTACYESVGLSSPFCSRFTRNGAKQITGNTSPTTNLDFIQTDGVDFSATYQMDLLGGGLSFSPSLTWLDTWVQEPNPIAGPTEYAGTIGEYGSYTHFRGQMGVNYDMDDWGVSLRERFIGGSKDTNAPATNKWNKVPDIYYSYLEGHVNYGAETLTVGIDNLFDQQPPFYDDYPDANTDIGTYDVVGRYFWVRLSTKL